MAAVLGVFSRSDSLRNSGDHVQEGPKWPGPGPPGRSPIVAEETWMSSRRGSEAETDDAPGFVHRKTTQKYTVSDGQHFPSLLSPPSCGYGGSAAGHTKVDQRSVASS